MKFKYFGKPNFNIVEVDSRIDKKTGMTYRPDTSDKEMIKECRVNYSGINITSNDIVMDLGANIGGFGLMAVKSGAKQIICFEPDDFNYELLEHNVKGPNVVLYKAAVISDDSDEVTFTIKDNKNSACSGSVNTSEKINEDVFHKQTVKAVNFSKMLDKYEPSILKIDIEGGEYFILEKSLPDYVEILALELHGSSKANYLKMFKMMDMLSAEWNIDFIDPVCVFEKLMLINIVLSRKDVKDIRYDFGDIDEMNIRSVKFDHILLSELRPIKGDQKSILSLLSSYYDDVIKPILK